MIFFFAKLLAMMAAQADLVAVASGGLLLFLGLRRMAQRERLLS